LLLIVLGGLGVSLKGSLVFGQVQLLLDLTLAESQFSIPILVLEGSADFAFEFFGALVAILNVRFHGGGSFLEAVDGCFERTRAKLMTLIRMLHHRHRQVLLLRYYSGLKFREIAARLNLPISNVQARLESACGKLRRLLYCDSRWGWLQKEFRDQF